MQELKSLNGSDQGLELKKVTGITWESNVSYNLTNAKELTDTLSRDNKLKPHTILYWLATKSYPIELKKKI